MDLIEFNGRNYPRFQAEGNAAQFAIPFARHVCRGKGYDIGCTKKEWSFPGSIPIDVTFEDSFHATNLPEAGVDYIFSSHCLEHLPNWVEVLDYWTSVLKPGGVLFLYLPHYNQEYWRPWYNRRHKVIFTPQVLKDYMAHQKYKHVFWSERDLNDSFMIFGTSHE